MTSDDNEASSVTSLHNVNAPRNTPGRVRLAEVRTSVAIDVCKFWIGYLLNIYDLFVRNITIVTTLFVPENK